MRDIVAGVVLIAIGLVFGGSVFLGDFSVTSNFVDCLGVFFIIKGVVAMRRAKQAAERPPAPAPPPAARR
jgi:hypothetical protein